MSRDVNLYLEDIELSALRVIEWHDGRDRAALFADEMRLDAIIRHLTIIGEAAKQVPPDVRVRAPSIPWPSIARFRDVLVHHYAGVSENVLWDVIHGKVPELLQEIRQLRARMTAENPEANPSE